MSTSSTAPPSWHARGRVGSLRQEFSHAQKAGVVGTRPYLSEDQAACRALVKNWRERLITGGMRAVGYGEGWLQ